MVLLSPKRCTVHVDVRLRLFLVEARFLHRGAFERLFEVVRWIGRRRWGCRR
jgi:hypothetical protein